MKFNVETSIDIQFTEEQIKAILTEVVQREMPNVEVSDIEWVIKRNPTSVSAKVDATMKGIEKQSTPRSISDTVEEAVEEVQETIEEAVEEVKNTVSSILDL